MDVDLRHARADNVASSVDRRGLTVVALSVVLGILAFGLGRMAADRIPDATEDRASLPDESIISEETGSPGPTTLQSTDPAPVVPRAVGGTPTAGPDRGGGTHALRFMSFTGPVDLIDAATDPDRNNSVAFDAAALELDLDGPIVAVTANVLVTGNAGTSLAIGPGDRPDAAIRFTVPSSGRLLVPHLVVAADRSQRIVVTATDHVAVRMEGIGVYVPALSSRAGRFIPTGSARAGSLVTATDGEMLVISLATVERVEPDHVGLAVLRLNASLGQSGGTLRVGSGPVLRWPASPLHDLALGATALVTVQPDSQGQIVFGFTGGSVLTADLVGFYTNDRAPDSTEGLLVLAPEPFMASIEVPAVGSASGTHLLPPSITDLTGPASGALIAIEVANGADAGPVRVTDAHTSPRAEPAFFVAPNQVHTTVHWIDGAASGAEVQAPPAAILRVWTLGVLQ